VLAGRGQVRLQLDADQDLVVRRVLAPAEAALEDLARQVAVTAHVVQLSQGLQRSREELVTTREEERRRLRRDLHDGLGPTLAAMTMRIDVALRLLEREPEAVAPQLVTLREESQRAIADIRRVAYGLRPPALDALGLVGAIAECTEQFGVADRLELDLALDLPDAVPSLPAAIEVAALRIVQEALANVAHHSGARACGVRLEVHTAVAIEVSDDGEGLPEDYRPGIGLHSMRERAAELGGTCAIEPRRPCGTRVLAQLPLAVH
jgi:signal transduction histidine kinase